MPRRKKKDDEVAFKDLPVWAKVLYVVMVLGAVLFCVAWIAWELLRITCMIIAWFAGAVGWGIYSGAKD